MHRDELIYQYSVAYRKCEAVMDTLAQMLLLAKDLPEELTYADMNELNPQTIAVEMQQLMQYSLQSDIRYLTRRTEEIADEHGNN